MASNVLLMLCGLCLVLARAPLMAEAQVFRTCPAGSICPDGPLITAQCELPCPVGSYCEINTFLYAAPPCPSGSYCEEPHKRKDCPPRHFCPESSTAPIPCP